MVCFFNVRNVQVQFDWLFTIFMILCKNLKKRYVERELKIMQEIVLMFKEVELENSAGYSEGCSGGRSDCCTRVCTRNEYALADEDSSVEAWEKYFEVEAGVVQY